MASYRANPPEVRKPQSRADKKRKKELQALAESEEGPSKANVVGGSKALAKEHPVGTRRSQRFATSPSGGG